MEDGWLAARVGWCWWKRARMDKERVREGKEQRVDVERVREARATFADRFGETKAR
jgi:hypothetical protein